MEYNFREIEKKWQQAWTFEKVYAVPNQSDKPKYYVLDMFPYPSGAGLHVGHPLGYIASDIVARYKRLKGFNVLHPMGYDAFGLPAEQYAIEHGVHPAVSTEQNINNFRKQLDKIGFCFDWDREVNTSNPKYYKWTQWIFLQLFNSWYNRRSNKTEPLHGLLKIFETEGNRAHPVPDSSFQIPGLVKNSFTAEEWKAFDEKTQQAILMEYRVAYCGFGEVNWCEALGTVLANDEVINGVSERGGYPVVKKKLRQWYLRITEYADRLLEGLQTVDFSEAMKDMQTNWIGKSSGAEIEFDLTPGPSPTELERGGVSVVEEPFPKYKVKDRLQFENARVNRKQHTEAEALLWEQLRGNKTGYKFRRQHPVDGFIADFACLQKGLIVEVDGGYHNTQEQQEYDQQRAKILQEKGFEFIRFTNEEVIENVYSVRDKIKGALTSQKETNTVNDQSPLSSSAGEGPGMRCYTTRPDTIFGVDFMVLAPEHELVEAITTPEQKTAVDEYLTYVRSRSERERLAEKKISGVFTGAYVQHPFTDKQIPVWISEYVLSGYGTGAIMAVPSGDERDHKFAQHFKIPITNIFGEAYTGEEAVTSKDVTLQNSGFLNGLKPKEAAEIVIDKLEEEGIGTRKVNYKMRDAAFSRQRYWGEPFPIVWKDGIAYPLEETSLPLELPYVESYKPGPEGEGPLANIPEWYLTPGPSPSEMERGETARRETNTMPGYAGSSWYFLRYMDPHNDEIFCNKTISSYWNQVDLYVGGTEHAVGHLLYSRMWTKALYDLGFISFDEPFKKLLNQGMITGTSEKIIRASQSDSESIDEFGELTGSSTSSTNSFIVNWLNTQYPLRVTLSNGDEFFVINYSAELKGKSPFGESLINVPIDYVDDGVLNLSEYLKEKRSNEIFVCKDGFYNSRLNKWFDFKENEINELEFRTVAVPEKMSKSKRNTISPDQIVEKYGADTFRMYEMFLGPVEASKPWDTKGIEGVHRFLKKLWRLFWAENNWIVTTEKATPQDLKALHKTIKKIEEDTERFSFNTAVSTFMICVNELTDLKCHKQEILEPLLILLAPYTPHIAEELYHQLRNAPLQLSWRGAGGEVHFPKWEEKHLVESTKEYPVSINGRLRTQISIALDAPQPEVETIVLSNDVVQKWLEGKPVKKFIFVPGKMVNVVV